ncbi:FtsK/SpoIIIE family DNA translocase [Planococcus salinarum]|uniref:FtsK/SpoIIIE family DNA translocase n=1 Tax=Planococcus salinarum TaxID=622695 RepID=UPI000E3D5C22|nr:DNA translocase FtsK [Planococcus salinarum]TAA72460.1 DNA translocase FtsK [Planococcus salinarum]
MPRSGQNKKKKKAPKAKAKKNNVQPLPTILFEIIGIVMLGVALLMAFQLGKVGRLLFNATEYMTGYLAFLVPVSLVLLAVFIMVNRKWPKPQFRKSIGSIFLLTGIFLISHLIWASGSILPITSANVIGETSKSIQISGTLWTEFTAIGGGMIGAMLYAVLHLLFETAGTWIVSIIILSIGAIILTGRTAAPFIAEKVPSFQPMIQSLGKRFSRPAKKEKENRVVTGETASNESYVDTHEPADNNYEFENETVYMDTPQEPIISAFTENVKPKQPEAPKETESETAEVATGEVQLLTTAEEMENEEYQLPPIDLLTLPPHSDQSGEYAGIQKNAKKLEKTFQSFGVRAKVTQVHLGPAVTKYEVLPDTGVKVSKIVSLHDDLALALAARDIRIEAPIPGKSAIGIEVPNSEVAIVSLREVLESEENNKPDSKLLFGLGRDVTGQAVMTELNKMPHLLVAGSTGSGKSVCINGIITSIIMRAKPHEVKMMMIDPKMVELNVYNGIPHLLAPVVTDPRKAAQALKKIVSEMERRYELFSHTGTRNIEGYNEYVRVFNEENEDKHPKLPFIVVIVDELADLMMVASNEVEDAITRLAQMARAAGIHLVIATQRPSVNVITGVIKANIPSRIAFAVSSAIDSRTILDMGGAEKLLGRGDMLFLGAGQSKPVRVQGAFLSDTEVEKIVDFAIEQQKAQYQEDMIPTEVEEKSIDDETDEIYDDAVQLVTEMQTASVSMLQRRFRVGYSRAARIIDQMEQRGVVGPYEGSKPRSVLVQKHEE